MKLLNRLTSCQSGVRVGSLAPDFTLLSDDGTETTLSDFRHKKNVILYFYPKDGTYNCTIESLAFRDQYETIKRNEGEIIGISSDSVESHARFAEKHRLPFRLVSDDGGRVRKLYGVAPTVGIVPGRVTYVIDKSGVVRHVFSSQFQPRSHVEEALTVLPKLATKSSESH